MENNLDFRRPKPCSNNIIVSTCLFKNGLTPLPRHAKDEQPLDLEDINHLMNFNIYPMYLYLQ